MKSKRKILSLAISALLTAGVASYPMPSYAKDDSSKTKVEEKKKEDSSKAKAEVAHTDSDKRSDSGSGDKSKQKITICHVPPGNPANKHTLHIAFSAWKAHQAHTNDKGPDFVDYLGSCNSKSASTVKETLHIISGCTGSYREALETKVQSHYEPITVADTALDDESVVTAMSQCLDTGDSSDSGKSHSDSSKSATGGKGRAHDSVSDSGNQHRIRGCQNRDSDHKADSSQHTVSDSDKSDTNKNYHKKLKDFDSAHDKAKGIKDPIVVSDSSLDDKDVWKEYKTCAKDSVDSNKLDSGKAGKKKGDSGHRQHILKSCGDVQDQKVRDAIVAYKAKTSTKDLILHESVYNDVSIKQAVEDCVNPDKGKGKDTPTNSFSPSVAIHGVTITGATITNATITSGVITGGTITAGTSTTANVIGGTITAGSSSGGSTTGGVVSGDTTTGATITGATVTDATVSTGVSGRLNFRENISPIKDEIKDEVKQSTTP